MSCCGQPNNQVDNTQAAHQVTPFPQQPISQQPGPQPSLPSWQGAEKGYQPPLGPSPPPQAHQNGWEKQQYPSYGMHGSPPPSSIHHTLAPSGSPPPGSITSPSAYNMFATPLQVPGFAMTAERSVPMTVSQPSSSPPRAPHMPLSDEGKVSVSIDFGASHRLRSACEASCVRRRYDVLGCSKCLMQGSGPRSALTLRLRARDPPPLTPCCAQAYGSSRIAGGKVQQILNWPGSFETFRKIPTCLLYDQTGQVIAWGIEAKNSGPMPGTTKCEWYVSPRLLPRLLSGLLRQNRTEHRWLAGSSYSSSLTRSAIRGAWILACPLYQ